MKVKLNCQYGDKKPNDVVDLKSDVAKKLIKSGNAFDANGQEATKDSKEISTLKEKVTALEDEKQVLKEKVTALEDAQAEITRLNDLVKEAIGLPKGQVPAGFEG